MENQIIVGDNLETLRTLPAGFVDLIYADPPFNTGRDYFVQVGGSRKLAFCDRWRWDAAAHASWANLKAEATESRLGAWMTLVECIYETQRSLRAYLGFMAPRLVQLHRVLKESGALYLHCDPNVSSELTLLLSAIFGRDPCSVIVWKRSSAHNRCRKFAPVHDNILVFPKSDKHVLNPVADGEDALCDFWLDIRAVGARAKERRGFQTQKPVALLERIIRQGSNPGDLVLDPFLGSGTTAVAAGRLGRRWVGLEQARHSAELAGTRVEVELGAGCFRVTG